MSDQQVQFFPFHGINEFMLNDYRQSVIHKVFSSLDKLPPDQRSRLVGSIKRLVQVPGFRNSALAPLPLKLKGGITAFEKYPQFTAQVLEAWATLEGDLRQQVFELLKSRGWELLPIETDRSKLPGFLIHWPKDETYEIINQAYNEMFPSSTAHENDVRLMTVWLADRLPIELDDQEEI